MEKRRSTMKIWNSTRMNLRLLSAKNDMPMTEIVDILVKREITREASMFKGGRDGKR